MIIYCDIKYQDENNPRSYQGLSTDMSFHERYTYNLKNATLRNINLNNSMKNLLGDFHNIEYINIAIDDINNIVKTYIDEEILDLSYTYNVGGPGANAIDEQIDITLKFQA